MASQPNPSSKVVFGPFEYDGGAGKLTKFGIHLRLQGKPLQILSILVNRPGQLIGREELQRHLWEGTTFVDFEQGLNSAVNKLRQTLGDSADQPLYVETVPGRGYRFVAPVQSASTKAILEMAPPAPARIERKPGRETRTWLAFVAGVALTAIVGGGYWLVNTRAGRAPAPKLTRLSVRPPSGFALEGAASRQSFALSPDGGRLAFTGAVGVHGDGFQRSVQRIPSRVRFFGVAAGSGQRRRAYGLLGAGQPVTVHDCQGQALASNPR
jgi:DNA-binding winged helix-turn-helix (wHTH) protein